MPLLKQYFYNKFNVKKTLQYIETGTYRGKWIKHVQKEYIVVYSIELAKQWYDYNVKKYGHKDKIKLYHGDSNNILPLILCNINEACTIYLDAHWSGGTTAHGEHETPLLQELETIVKRPFRDIIIIDDCRNLGKSGIGGIPNDKIYPEMEYNCWI
jgi:superfamily II DNA or RNA helicase